MNMYEFLEYEKNAKLFDRTYKGFPYWQTVRFTVCMSLFGQRNRMERKMKRSLNYVVSKLWATFYLFFRCLGHSVIRKKKKHKDVIIIKDQAIKDKFFDTWVLPPGIEYVIYRCREYSPEFAKSDIVMDFPLLMGRFNYIIDLFLRNRERDSKEADFLGQLSDELSNRFGQCVSGSEIEKEILKNRRIYSAFEDYYRKILSEVKPRCIIIVLYYQSSLFPLYKIAKEMEIPVVELQHGVINNHPEYWFEDLRGINNYTPDYLLTFGKIHSEWTKLLPSEKVVDIGFPFQEMQLKQYSNLKTEEKTIIIYPQQDDEFESVIDEFASKMTNNGYKVLIKLHPLQSDNYQQFYPVLSSNKNVKFITSQSEGIYYWLKLGKHHIMGSTTVGLEAMAFDHCNVCIAEMISHEQTQCLLDWGVARGFKTVKELERLIINPIDNDDDNLRKIRNELWKRNARRNMTEFFGNLLQNDTRK